MKGVIRQLPDLSELQRMFRYEPSTGKLFWKIKPNGRVENGSEIKNRAGKNRCYVQVQIKNKSYAVHRIVWALHYQELPDVNLQIDHMNGIGYDNRIENLRLCTNKENRNNPVTKNRKNFHKIRYC
jgi:hypothetical protein